MNVFQLCLVTVWALLPFGVQSQVSKPWTSCSPQTFSFPSMLGTNLLDIHAEPSLNFTAMSLAPGTDHQRSYTIDFCNVTVSYTHPGWNDTINVSVWLPSPDSWTGRLQALGGGGWNMKFGALYSTQAVARGDVAVDTDGGHDGALEFANSPQKWALTSPGNVNFYLLDDFSSRALHEMAVIGKAITHDFYGSHPKSSFFNGCSQGGRQGLMLAQRYPADFDGILAIAPAINIPTFVPSCSWAYHVMNTIGIYPAPCEIEAFTQAAIAHCDELDDVKDGIISNPALCDFEASSVVGESFSCDGTKQKLTAGGARIVQAAWDGPHSTSGHIGWFGLNKDAQLYPTFINTQCENGTCSAVATELLNSWNQYFVAKDPEFNMSDITTEQFFSLMAQSRREYQSIIGTTDTDLSQFHAKGGKMITWHGLADQIIPPDGTISYYQQVMKANPHADSFYRFFEAPGVGHCISGPGYIPNTAFDQLVKWVEDGKAPDTLMAVSPDGHQRHLCPYPQRQVYVGGAMTNPRSFKCAVADDSEQSRRFQVQEL